MRRLLAACALTLSACAALAIELPAEGSTEVLFSPWDDVEGGLIAVLGKARHSIHVQAYLLTSRNIAKALLQAHQRGVKVEILADAATTLKGDNSQVPQLAAAGIPVWLETRYANAHNKVMLIDVAGEHPAVLTGSYNYTWSAQARNAENLLILRDNHALAHAYLKNWRRHQREAEPFIDLPASEK
ncbi:MAG: phospholipase D family protein [Rhodocyclaceae bacterium]|nr:phospholipase D family protein [Rhodocyclaceae bacterium]